MHYRKTSFLSELAWYRCKRVTTKICLDWSLPHYEDCGWYLNCSQDACTSSEKTIRQINDAKIVDPRDTAILQAQIVQLKLREPEPKETKHRKSKICSWKQNTKPTRNLTTWRIAYSFQWFRWEYTRRHKIKNLGAMYWNFIIPHL